MPTLKEISLFIATLFFSILTVILALGIGATVVMWAVHIMAPHNGGCM